MATERERHDVIVIGAGLSGLTAALRLAGAGLSVLVLEKRCEAGGLCGTKCVGGYEFVVACNDFGVGLRRILEGLGVRASFQSVRTRFHFDTAAFELPAGPRALARLLLPRLADLLRVGWAARRTPDACLGSLLRRHVRDPTLADLIASLAYPLGVAPEELPVTELGAQLSREHAYGYTTPLVPVGGPAILVRQMAERLEEQGGRIVLNAESVALEREGAERIVHTRDGRAFRARHLVSSEPPAFPPAEDAKPGMALSMLLLAVRKDLPFPAQVHTLTHFPSRIAEWLGALDAGERPQEYGFHLFRNHLPERPDHDTLQVCCFLPRGEDDPSPERVRAIEDDLLARSERLLPGLGRALLFRRFLGPRAFTELHGMSSRPTRRVPRAGAGKPPHYDRERDLHRVGGAVGPPGEHAGQAVLSGLRGAEALLQHRVAAG